MSIYSTTALPSLDLLGGVEALQRLLDQKAHTHIAKIAWDDENSRTIAVLETNGQQNAVDAVAEIMQRFQLELIECRSLAHAVSLACTLAHNKDVVDFTGFVNSDPYSI
jgi:uncharacterized membrane-anchored protein YjiN (DUF445 family)